MPVTFFTPIGDGYDLDFKIPAHRGTPAVSGKYRPALPEEAAEYWFATNRAANGTEQATLATKFIVEHVKSWDAKYKGSDGSVATAPITVEWIRKNVPWPMQLELRSEILAYGDGEAQADEKN